MIEVRLCLLFTADFQAESTATGQDEWVFWVPASETCAHFVSVSIVRVLGVHSDQFKHNHHGFLVAVDWENTKQAADFPLQL